MAANEPAILNGASGELLVSIILIIGMLAGVTAKIAPSSFNWPDYAGILVGPYVLNLIGHTEEKIWQRLQVLPLV